MSSVRVRKSAKIAERMTELKDEVKEFHKHTEEIIEICTDHITKMKEIQDLDTFLELYAMTYRYLSHCTASFFEFNCRMETLLMGADCVPSYLQKVSSLKEISFNRQEETGFADEQITISTGIQSEMDSDWKLEDNIPEKENSIYPEDADSSTSLTEKEECNIEKKSLNQLMKLSKSEESIEQIGNNLNENKETHLENEDQIENNLRNMKFNRKVGAIHDVILVRLVSPDEFYVYILCEDLEKIEHLKEKLSKINWEDNKQEWNNNSSLHHNLKKILASNMIGSYALGFSQELSSWMRIKILNWRTEKNDDLVEILDIDHGTSCLLPLNKIIPMTYDLKEYPIFIQKCYLPFIVPIKEDWSEEDKTIFQIFTESTEFKSRMEIEITEIDPDRKDEAIGVNLFLPNSQISINDKLVEFGIAEERDTKSRGKYLPLCAIGDKIPVKVTCISRVNHIFCVRDYSRMNENDELQYLIELLNDPGSEMAELEIPPKIGDFVIARYEDGLWYRAQVVKSNRELNNWRVIFLDYGNTESVSVNDFRKIEEKHLKIPFQMIECLLEEVELKQDGNPYKGITYLNERVAEDVTIEIRRVLDGVRSFYSVNIFDKSGNDIVEDMVIAGVAGRLKKC